MKSSYQLSVVLPTYNEVDNIAPLYQLLEATLNGIKWQAIFVDDNSPDGTGQVIHQLKLIHDNIFCIDRVERKGLSSAFIEGAMSSDAPFIAIIDVDLQHDETLLPQMYDYLSTHSEIDLVNASRYIHNNKVSALSWFRRWGSRFSIRLSRFITLTNITDPMSGFFMVKRSSLTSHLIKNLYLSGYKILLDILTASQTPFSIHELPYKMRKRHTGVSKLDSLVIGEYLALLLNKIFKVRISTHFLLFSLVGFSGMIVHMYILYYCLFHLTFPFYIAQGTGTIIVMTNNFILNNLFTYKDQRLKGIFFVKGLFLFYISCSFGALINLSIATTVYNFSTLWWLAGAAGTIAGAFWNYWLTKKLVW